MATQKHNETQGDGGQRHQAMTVRRGQQGQQGQQGRQLERRGGQRAMRSTRNSPFSMMQRMLDDFDTSLWSPFAGTSPFSMMRRMFDDMERMLDTDLFSDVDWGGRESIWARESTWAPRVEIMQHGDNLVVRADLPGISQDEINLSTENGALVIEGERAAPGEGQQATVWSTERPYGRFRRVVILPEGVDPEKAEARYQSGVLEVSMPFPAAQVRGRQIQIQTGGKTSEQRQDLPLQETAPPAQQAERR